MASRTFDPLCPPCRQPKGRDAKLPSRSFQGGITIENATVWLRRVRKQLRWILAEKCRFERDERNVLVREPVLETTGKGYHAATAAGL